MTNKKSEKTKRREAGPPPTEEELAAELKKLQIIRQHKQKNKKKKMAKKEAKWTAIQNPNKYRATQPLSLLQLPEAILVRIVEIVAEPLTMVSHVCQENSREEYVRVVQIAAQRNIKSLLYLGRTCRWMYNEIQGRIWPSKLTFINVWWNRGPNRPEEPCAIRVNTFAGPVGCFGSTVPRDKMALVRNLHLDDIAFHGIFRNCASWRSEEKARESFLHKYGDLSGVETLTVDLEDCSTLDTPTRPSLLEVVRQRLSFTPRLQYFEDVFPLVLSIVFPSLRRVAVNRVPFTVKDDDFPLKRAIAERTNREYVGTVSDWTTKMYGPLAVWPPTEGFVRLGDVPDILAKSDHTMCTLANKMIKARHPE